MKKVTLYLFVAIIAIMVLILVAGVYKFNFTNSDIHTEKATVKNAHDATYMIDGQKVTLVNGVSEVSATPGSASKIITRYFGNDVKGDFNGDGKEDIAFYITQETGGSGTFFYVTALLDGKIPVSAVFIGDRIAPQAMNMEKGNTIIDVNYADRNPGESFAVPPSLGKTLRLKFDPKILQFGEVAQNFEGEADPSRMTLGMKKWNWIRTTYENGKTITPKKANVFGISFNKDGNFSATTDCNTVGGGYTVNGNKISFGNMMSTLMYCDGSQESDFTKMLSEAINYKFTSKGELILTLKGGIDFIIFQ